MKLTTKKRKALRRIGEALNSGGHWVTVNADDVKLVGDFFPDDDELSNYLRAAASMTVAGGKITFENPLI